MSTSLGLLSVAVLVRGKGDGQRRRPRQASVAHLPTPSALLRRYAQVVDLIMMRVCPLRNVYRQYKVRARCGAVQTRWGGGAGGRRPPPDWTHGRRRHRATALPFIDANPPPPAPIAGARHGGFLRAGHEPGGAGPLRQGQLCVHGSGPGREGDVCTLHPAPPHTPHPIAVQVDPIPASLRGSMKFDAAEHVVDVGGHPLLSSRGGPASPREDTAVGITSPPAGSSGADNTLNPMRASRVVAMAGTNAPITASMAGFPPLPGPPAGPTAT
jgi:hypothetical protein